VVKVTKKEDLYRLAKLINETVDEIEQSQNGNFPDNLEMAEE
jgi:hypothetical protein